MTVLNFPASPTVNDTYTANNVTYTWNGNYWEANNTGSFDNIYVEVAGDSMTGNLLLPGGGGNTAALQKQEITDLPVSTFDNDSGYITSSDIPPGTVSYWKKDGSDLKPVSDTDNVNIGDGNITLNAADGSGSFENTIKAKEGCTVGTNTLGLDIILENDRKDVVYHAKTSSTDTRHLWRLNNIDRASIDYNGDMAIGITGSFTPSTPAISLNAAGSSEFNGNMQVNGRIDSAAGLKVTRAGAGGGYLSIGNSDTNCYSIYNGTETTSRSYYDGTLQIGGVLNSSSPTSTAPNITLNADGSAIYSNYMQVGDYRTDNGESKVSSGNVQSLRNVGGVKKRIILSGSDSQSMTISADLDTGNVSAQLGWDGTLKLGGTLPAAPNIQLGANGNIFAGDNVNPGADTDRGFAVVNGVNRCAVKIQSKSVDSEGGVLKILKGTSETFSVTNTGNVIAVGDIQSTSQNGAQIGGFRNQLINGDFRVWQRSADVTVSGAGETGVVAADRWYMSFDGRYIRRSEAPDGFRYSLQVTNTNPLVTTYALRQGIELFDASGNTNATPFKVGSQWTLSFWTTGNPVANGGVFRLLAVPKVGSSTQTSLSPDVLITSTGETSNGFTRYSATVTINTSTSTGSGVTAIECFLGGLTEFAATGRFTGFQLEPGPVATPFEHRPIQTELALCQRYYQTCDNLRLGSTDLTTANREISIPRFVTMRADPTEAGTPSASMNSTSYIGKADNLRITGKVNTTSQGAQISDYTATAEL